MDDAMRATACFSQRALAVSASLITAAQLYIACGTIAFFSRAMQDGSAAGAVVFVMRYMGGS